MELIQVVLDCWPLPCMPWPPKKIQAKAYRATASSPGPKIPGCRNTQNRRESASHQPTGPASDKKAWWPPLIHPLTGRPNDVTLLLLPVVSLMAWTPLRGSSAALVGMGSSDPWSSNGWPWRLKDWGSCVGEPGVFSTHCSDAF